MTSSWWLQAHPADTETWLLRTVPVPGPEATSFDSGYTMVRVECWAHRPTVASRYPLVEIPARDSLAVEVVLSLVPTACWMQSTARYSDLHRSHDRHPATAPRRWSPFEHRSRIDRLSSSRSTRGNSPAHSRPVALPISAQAEVRPPWLWRFGSRWLLRLRKPGFQHLGWTFHASALGWQE